MNLYEEVEINETTTACGVVVRTEDAEGDPNVIGGINKTYDYEVQNIIIKFMGIDVTSLLDDEKKDSFKKDLIDACAERF